jgi:hypothetical protein
MNDTAAHFFCEKIAIFFATPPVRQKTLPCQDYFTWQRRAYWVVEKSPSGTIFTTPDRLCVTSARRKLQLQ